MPDPSCHRRPPGQSATLVAICGLLICAWLAALSVAPDPRLEQGSVLGQDIGLGFSEHAGDRAPPDELLSARTAVAKRRIEPFHLQLPEGIAVLAVVLWFSIFALPPLLSSPRYSHETFSPVIRHPRLRRSGVSRAPPTVS